ARRRVAYSARTLGETGLADTMAKPAARPKELFDGKFWAEQRCTYIPALVGSSHNCSGSPSRAGCCSVRGAASAADGARTRATLMNECMFTGWGSRTLADREARYNPMSYHNGSVWPHDTAVIAAGMARYGFTEDVIRLTQALFDASLYIDLQRLPELYCGFPTRTGVAPTTYPVACSPQAWSVASASLLIESFLQIRIDAMERKVSFRNPTLPEFMDHLWISNLKCGEGYLNFKIYREGTSVYVSILEKPEGWQVVHL